MINGIKTSAPLFNGAPEDDLRRVVECLSSASYHYADDSASEWGLGRKRVTEARDIIIRHQLGYAAIRNLHADKSQLVSLDELMCSVMVALYSKASVSQ